MKLHLLHPVSLKGLPQRGLRGNAQFCWFVLLGPSPPGLFSAPSEVENEEQVGSQL